MDDDPDTGYLDWVAEAIELLEEADERYKACAEFTITPDKWCWGVHKPIVECLSILRQIIDESMKH